MSKRTEIGMTDGRSLIVQGNENQAVVTIVGASGAKELSLEIRIEVSGPVLSVKGVSIEVEAARRVGIRCDEFVVQAQERIELSSGGTLLQRSSDATQIDAKSVSVDARMGGFRVNASDDVQMLGELILLNCERAPLIPAWATEPEAPVAPLVVEGISGDASLAEEMSRKV